MVSPFCGNQSNLPWPQTLAKQSIAQTCFFPNFLALCLDFTKIPVPCSLASLSPLEVFLDFKGPHLSPKHSSDLNDTKAQIQAHPAISTP